MKISWFSNAPWAPTGYGAQTAEVVPRLMAAGHEVMVACNYGLQGAPIEWNGIPVYPQGIEAHSTALSPAHHEHWGGDWMITLYDVWPLKRNFFPERTASWVPVDHQPVPPEVLKWCESVRVIAMSRFGERQLREQGLNPTYIPHSIDTKVFTPDGPSLRSRLKVPDSGFLVLINAANKGVTPPRKAWPEMFTALSVFMRQTEDAYVYVHTDHRSSIGLDLNTLAVATGLPKDRIRWADAYALTSGHISQADVAGIYRASDVLLAPSMGEGFGIPVIEAEACGVPVIVSDFSAQPELCASDWMVRGQPYWDPAQKAFFFTPYIGDILARLKDAYAARGSAEQRDKAVALAAGYDSDLVFTRHWRPFLAELEAAMDTPAPTQAPNRAARRAAKRKKVPA